MIVFIYATLIFLVLRFSVTLFNFLSNPKLGYYGKHFSDKVSIVVIEEPGDQDHGPLLESIKNQDYSHVEIIIRQAGYELEDVVGKAEGKYLLLLKGDLTINAGLINNLIYRMKVYDLSLLSLIPNRKIDRLIDFIYSLKDFVLLNIFPLRIVRLINMPVYFVSRQPCMFLNTERYRNNQKTADESKARMELLHANKFVYQWGHAGLTTIGLDVLKVLGNNVWAGLFYLALVIAGPIVMFLNFEPVFWALPLGLIFLTRIMIAFLTAEHPVKSLLLHPVQMGVLVLALSRGMVRLMLKTGKNKN